MAGRASLNAKNLEALGPARLAELLFQVKIVLEGSKPPIWRRVLIPANLRLPDLHGVIQLAMGWRDAHLYHFMVGLRSEGLRFYGDPDPLDIDLIQQAEGRFINDLNVPIDHLLVNRNDLIRYEYDFGDGWIHRLTLEDIHVQPLKLARLPRCVAGQRACPPEDCGGVPGYEQALEILANPAHPEHQELLVWIGNFDPKRFDLEAVNAELVESLLTSRSSWPRSYPRLKIFHRREFEALSSKNG